MDDGRRTMDDGVSRESSVTNRLSSIVHRLLGGLQSSSAGHRMGSTKDVLDPCP